ncbi:MAG: DUF2634 domain-containing protein [Hydrogenoanaerobacterium sp.]
MTPKAQIPQFTPEEPPSKTWRIDFENNRISGYIDELEAVAQSALMALQTERYKHIIFSWQYGSELHTLIGRDDDYLFSEAKRMITEALSTDSRIKEVKDFVIKGKVLFFTIDTIFGSTQIGTEVKNE